MLQLNHVTITHQKDLQTLISQLNLIINPGEKVAIIGEEGTGKSTLIKAIVAPQELDAYAKREGEILNRFRNIGYLPQQLTSSQLAMTVSDFIYQELDYQQFDFNTFYRLAEQFGLSIKDFESHRQTLGSLSGGEKLKIQLLKLLAYDPDFLVLDEPTSDLDLVTITWLERFIKHSDKTVLFISHDETLLSHTATAILHLELLKKRTEPRATFFVGNYDQYKATRKQKFEKDFQIANKEREEHYKKVTENHRIQQSVQHALRTTKSAPIGRLLAKKMHTLQSQDRRFQKEAESFTEIPQDMDAIHLFFDAIHPLPKTKRLLHWENVTLDTGQQADWQLFGQDKIVITGKNGIGKTRLLKNSLTALQQNPQLSVGYMPQQYDDLFVAGQTPLSFLSEAAPLERCRSLLASLQFTRQEVEHTVSDLSGGQKAKLCLAKMVLAGNNVLILDEPTRHFSPTSQPLVRQLLVEYPGCIVSVSHDRQFIEDIGQIKYQLTDDQLKRLD